MIQKKLTGISIVMAFIVVVSVALTSRTKVLGTKTTIANENVRGLVIPHHDLADELIISSIQEIAKENTYDHIFVIGPNHFFPENPLIVSGTVIQDFSIDMSFVNELNTVFNSVSVNNDILAGEHSMIVPMKYLREAYPNALFVPLVVSPHYTQKDLSDLTLYLSKHAPENSLWVLGMDFAHNVTINEGLSHNEESITALSTFDYQTILRLTDTHMDSPVGATLFLQIMEVLNAREWTTLESSHGAIIDGVPNLNGTSYVIGTFKEDLP